MWSFLIGLIIIALDQLSKAWIRANLSLGEALFDWGFFRVTYVRNMGAAFGIFPDQSFLLTIIALVGGAALVLLSLFSNRLSFLNTKLNKAVLGLVLGGTLGNLIDRLRFGYVTDFIDFSFWPAFNVADSAITIGALIFVYSFIVSVGLSVGQEFSITIAEISVSQTFHINHNGVISVDRSC